MTTTAGKVRRRGRREVVGVVRRRDLHDAGAELPVDEDRVLDDRDLPVHDRQDRRLALAARRCARRPDGSRAPCRRASSRAASSRPPRRPSTPGHVVAHVVQRSLRLAVHDLEVRDRGLAARAPVDDVAPAVDQAVAVEAHEGVPDRPREIRVHREAQAAPVERAAEPPQLREDRVAGLPAPRPHALDELFPAEVPAPDPLLRELALDDHLGRDAGVVGARKPQDPAAAHALPARQDVLDRAAVGVADVEAPGDVRRRDDHDEARRPRRAPRLEAAFPLPEGVPALLEVRRVEGLLERLDDRVSAFRT